MDKFSLSHHSQRGYGLYTKKPYKKGTRLLEFVGDILPTHLIDATQHKLYLPIDYHFCIKWLISSNQSYINHSCNPNCFIDFVKGIPVLTAARDILLDEELCYNYNTIYLDLTRNWSDFPCHCYSLNCIGKIKGFLYLSVDQEQEILHMCSPYLKNMRDEYRRNAY